MDRLWTAVWHLYISLFWSKRARERLDYTTLYCSYTKRWWDSTALRLVRNHERVELNYSRELQPLWWHTCVDQREGRRCRCYSSVTATPSFLYRHVSLSVVSREQSEKTKRLKTGGSDARVYCFSFYGGYTTLIVTSGHQPSWCPTLLCTFKNKQTHTHTQTNKSQTHGGRSTSGGTVDIKHTKYWRCLKTHNASLCRCLIHPQEDETFFILTFNRSVFSFEEMSHFSLQKSTRWLQTLHRCCCEQMNVGAVIFFAAQIFINIQHFSDFQYLRFWSQLPIKYIYLKMQWFAADQPRLSVFTQCADNDILKGYTSKIIIYQQESELETHRWVLLVCQQDYK